MQAPFILLVEDDATLRAILTRNLEARGYMVLQAGTFREATDLLAIRPGLLVLDITLPDATGWEVGRTSRRTAAASSRGVEITRGPYPGHRR